MRYYRDSIGFKWCTLIGVALLMGTLLSGCQPSTHNTSVLKSELSVLKAEMALLKNAAKEETVPPSRILLEAGDALEVKFFHTPELNETQTVNPDGCIALQLIGEVKVEGVTPTQLRDGLLQMYASHLKDPDIVVVVRSYQNRRVFVGGEVKTPGIVQMPGELTVLEAIMQAGGFDMREAEVRNVVVIRHLDDQRYGYSLDLKAALAGEATRPFYLEPKDIVYVPRTSIAKINQWVDQHINKIIPRTGFIFMKTTDDSTIGINTSSVY